MSVNDFVLVQGVRDTRGIVIPGLFASGEVLGCFHGKRYGGGGMSIGSAVLFGRDAGRVAAQEALARQPVLA